MVLVRSLFTGLLSVVLVQVCLSQQIIINEVMSSNQQYLRDEDGDTPDWLEIWNNSNEVVDLADYSVSDDMDTSKAWHFPAFSLSPDQYLLVFASGKDKKDAPQYWETIIKQGDAWKYIIPSSEINSDWRGNSYDDAAWSDGTSGIGYGDNDDNTTVPASTISVFMRKSFTIKDKNLVQKAILHMDYDDAFVAYLNGNEIARANITSSGPPAYNAFADNSSHEALMYTGGNPNEFPLENIQDLLIDGENVLAIQVHNAGTNSSDLTAIPFLSLGFTAPVSGSVEDFVDLPQSKFHTDFSISSSGESLYLFKNNILEDSIQVLALPTNISYGRNSVYTDVFNYFPDPTPEAKNTTQGYTSLTGGVTFSAKGGIFYNSLSLSLSSDNASDHIYYTTDYTEPTKSSTPYTGPISISSTMAIRAAVINDGGMPGPVCTETYLFNIQHDLPVISLVSEPDNFFGYETGIYVEGPGHTSSGENCDNGQNWWQDWERQVNVSMILPSGQQAFSQDAGVKIFGGCSRNFAQKSLSLRFRSRYGKEGLDYKVFDELNTDKFYSLNLRSSGNDWNQTMMKDAYASRFFPDEIDKQAYQPAVVYINGEYWGIHNIRERFDEYYYATHYDIDPTTVNIMQFHVNWLINLVQGDDQHYLDLMDFIEDNDLTVPENYTHIQQQMDVENFALYEACNIAVKNTDWPGNNVKYWQSFDYDTKWRWMTFDLDFGFSDVNHNTLTFAMADNNTGWPNPALSTYLLRRMNTNEDFQHVFINAFADVINTLWQSDYYLPIFNKMKSAISSEIPAHMLRWNGDSNGWSSRVDGLKNFSSQRPNVVKNFVRNYYDIDGMYGLTLTVNDAEMGDIKVNTVDLGKYGYPWNGDYFNDVPVRLVARPKKGYSFKYWSGSVSSTKDTVFVTANKSSTVKAVFKADPSYKEIIIINEVFYKNVNAPTPEDWVEIYNKGDNAVDLSNWILKDDDDDHVFILPEGTAIEAKGYLVICRNARAVADYYGYAISKTGDFDFGFANEGDCVRLYNQKEILVDSLAYSNPDPDNNGAFSYQRIEKNDTAEWFMTDNYGTPGKENVYWGTPVAHPVAEESVLLTTYPNPFRDQLSLTFEISERTFVSISLLGQDGKYIRQIEDGTFNSGSYTINWKEGADLPKGMYMVIIKTNKQVKTEKVIKL
ncbi:CotH kinase family protein [Saccharicrinis sp. FJH2]|uniref:CotH kinase family protein n=1 Tax=Saccharicrinis sp. FJH65 TaxID=3344659 RepID=UPI0035F39BA2